MYFFQDVQYVLVAQDFFYTYKKIAYYAKIKNAKNCEMSNVSLMVSAPQLLRQKVSLKYSALIDFKVVNIMY